MLFVLVLQACASAFIKPEPKYQYLLQDSLTGGGKKGWYALRFTIPWDKKGEPKWYIGTLIAGEVISPLLMQRRDAIDCWRIHRRAVDDKTGHVFSFIFYSSQANAMLIYQQLKDYKILIELQNQHLITKVSNDPLYRSEQTKIADTSDAAWPEKMRETWPYFMMGASQMWLAQVDAFKQETDESIAIEQRYISLHNKITELWQQQGQHALMHHLNAVYAYQPILVRF